VCRTLETSGRLSRRNRFKASRRLGHLVLTWPGVHAPWDYRPEEKPFHRQHIHGARCQVLLAQGPDRPVVSTLCSLSSVEG